MKNAEIKALVEQTREKIISYGNGYHMPAAPLCTAIETLLARQAEVVKYAEGYTLHAAPIRAILNPEETPNDHD